MRYLYVSEDLRWWVTSEEACIDGRCAIAQVMTQEDSDGKRRRYHRLDANLWARLRVVHPPESIAPIRARLVELYGAAAVEAGEAKSAA